MKRRTRNVVHQALHGYDEGHRLVAASTTLDRRDESTMLALSDLPGSGFHDEFSPVLTGYPLAGAQYYVIGRTWYAPEMHRPGCVWTHSLLVPWPVLAELDQPGSLCALLRRPDTGQLRDRYAKEIVVDELPRAASGMWDHQVASVFASILDALYRPHSLPVLVYADSPEQFEDGVLLVWAQQWAQLRRTFTFCVGAFVDRSSTARLFDLQVLHASAHRRASSGERITITDRASDWGRIGESLWQDLTDENHGLRAFLNRYGPCVAPDRSSVGSLVELYLRLPVSANQDMTSFIETLATGFDGEDAAALRTSILLGEWIEEDKDDARHVAAAILRAACSSELDMLVDSSLLEASIVEWLDDAPGLTLDLIVDIADGEENRLAVLVREAIAASVRASHIDSVAKRPSAVFWLVRSRPSLAAFSELWLAGPSSLQAMLEALESPRTSHRGVATKVARAVIGAGRDDVASAVVRRLPWLIGPLLADFSNEPRCVTSGWRRALERVPDIVSRWLSTEAMAKPRAIRLVADLIPPTGEIFGASQAEVIAEALRAERRGDAKDVDAFYFVCAMESATASADTVVRLMFEPMYVLAQRDALTARARLWLDERLPRLKKKRNWDICLRLLQWLRDRVISQEWGPDEVLESVAKKELRARLATILKKDQRTRQIGQAVAGATS